MRRLVEQPAQINNWQSYSLNIESGSRLETSTSALSDSKRPCRPLLLPTQDWSQASRIRTWRPARLRLRRRAVELALLLPPLLRHQAGDRVVTGAAGVAAGEAGEDGVAAGEAGEDGAGGNPTWHRKLASATALVSPRWPPEAITLPRPVLCIAPVARPAELAGVARAEDISTRQPWAKSVDRRLSGLRNQKA